MEKSLKIFYILTDYHRHAQGENSHRASEKFGYMENWEKRWKKEWQKRDRVKKKKFKEKEWL